MPARGLVRLRTVMSPATFVAFTSTASLISGSLGSAGSNCTLFAAVSREPGTPARVITDQFSHAGLRKAFTVVGKAATRKTWLSVTVSVPDEFAGLKTTALPVV